MYAANPKNLTVGISAGVVFGAANFSGGAAVTVAVLYVLLASSTVLVPVSAFLLAWQRVKPWLDEMRDWLTQHNAAIMSVLLLVIGMMMAGKGLIALAYTASAP
nr:GAP family protein [Novosphingobium sp. PhB57]